MIKSKWCFLKSFFIYIIFINAIILWGVGHGYTQSFQSESFSPKVRVTYEFKFCPDTLNKQDIVSKKMYLFICDSVSVFLNAEKFIFDSILSNEQSFKAFDLNSPDFSQKAQSLISNLPKNQDNSVIIKNFQDKSMRVIDLVGLDYYFYDEEDRLFEWKIVDGTTKFDSLLCKIAKVHFRGRNYSAMFSSDVGIPDGPYKFSSLPGLIVHLIDDRQEVEYRLLAIENYPLRLSLIGTKSGRKVSRQKMRELKLEYFLNPFAHAEINLKNFKMDDNQKATIIESRKKILAKKGNKIEKD